MNHFSYLAVIMEHLKAVMHCWIKFTHWKNYNEWAV